MDSKEVKALLKDVKKTVQEKNYERALAQCKKVIKLDPLNYTGLVFLGFSAQELGHWTVSEEALKQAISVDATQLLAWKGLSTLYEKNVTSENQEKLVPVYEELIQMLNSDLPKQKEVIFKLVALTHSLGLQEKNINANVLKAGLVEDDADRFAAWKIVALKQSSETKETSNLRIKEKAFSEALKCQVDENIKIPLQKEFIKFLKQINKLDEAVEEALQLMIKVDPDDRLPILFICQTFVETSAVDILPIPSDLDKVFELSELLRQSPTPYESAIALVTQGAILLAKKEPWKALSFLSEGVASSTLPHSYILLSKAQLACHCYKLSEKSAVNGLKMSPRGENKLAGVLCLLLTKSLLAQRAQNEALFALKKCQQKMGINNKTELCLLHWCILANSQEKAEEVIQKLDCGDLTSEERSEFAYLKSRFEFQSKKNFSEALKILESSFEFCQTGEALHLRAAILWESGQQARALEALVQAIKSDPYCPRNYLYLGDYYHEKGNENRACQCYLKGHQLDQSDEDIARRASDLLLMSGDTVTNQEVLLAVTSNNSRSAWAWLRLGLSYLPTGKSVDPLQRAVRLDPENSTAWEALGDAYLNQGSYSAALNAFNKSSDLLPGATYPMFRSATISKLTGHPEEALEKFRNILKIDPSFVAAVEGLTESCLQMAQQYISLSVFELAKDVCFQALQALPEILLHEQNSSCLWKLSGDLHMLLASLGPKHFPLKPDVQRFTVSLPDSKSGLHSAAIRYYGHALAVCPEISWLWQDLGSAYSCVPSEESLLKASACFHQALTLNPNEASHWTAMAFLIFQHQDLFDPNLAQHCFIQALQLDPDSALTWCGLGLLYLDTGLVELAQSAFSKSQAIDPGYSNAWVGLAMVAERISPEDSLDLYWHSTNLSQNPCGMFGYSLGTCSALLDGSLLKDQNEQKHIVHATDCLQHITANDQSSGPVLNALALFMERQGLLHSALDASRKCLEQLPASFKEPARNNLARLLRQSGNCVEALEVLSQVSGSGDVDILCEMAFAHWTLGNWEQAYQVYHHALQKCPPTMKSHVLVAMAMVQRKLGNSEETTQLLLKSSTLKPVSIAGLLAISAEGFLSGNEHLVNASILELRKYRLDPNFALDVAQLMTLNEIKKNQLQKAKRLLSSAVHQHPSLSALWAQLSLLLIKEGQNSSSSNGLSSALVCALASARLLKSGYGRPGCLRRNADQRTSLQAIVTTALIEGNTVEAFRAVQASAHVNPGDIASWNCLLACLLAQNKWNDSVCDRVLQVINEPSLLEWLYCCHSYHHLLNGRQEEAKKVLSKITTSKDKAPSSSVSFLRCAMGSLEDIKAYLDRNVLEQMVWRLLVTRLIMLSQFEQAKVVLRNWMKVLTSLKLPKSSLLTPLLMMALVSWEAVQSCSNEEDKNQWLTLGEESVSIALKDNKNCAAVYLVAAQFAHSKGNFKFEKKFLSKCLTLAETNNTREIYRICKQRTLDTSETPPPDHFDS